MPRYLFVGSDPIDHFHLGRVSPGDVVELDDRPPGPWEPQGDEKPPPRTGHGSDTPSSTEED